MPEGVFEEGGFSTLEDLLPRGIGAASSIFFDLVTPFNLWGGNYGGEAVDEASPGDAPGVGPGEREKVEEPGSHSSEKSSARKRVIGGLATLLALPCALRGGRARFPGIKRLLVLLFFVIPLVVSGLGRQEAPARNLSNFNNFVIDFNEHHAVFSAADDFLVRTSDGWRPIPPLPPGHRRRGEAVNVPILAGEGDNAAGYWSLYFANVIPGLMGRLVQRVHRRRGRGPFAKANLGPRRQRPIFRYRRQVCRKVSIYDWPYT